MSTYLQWNDALAENFFRSEMAGQEVWLFVTDDLIEKIGEELDSGGVGEFVEAVQTGPPWVRARGLCQRALQAWEGWRERGFDYPPYIGYLSLFVLAAGLEGDFVPHAYYPRLRSLLGDDGTDAPPSFERMLELWDDLERWSTHDKAGSLGVFIARIVGGWIHVGLPVAQTILSEHERRALPGIFAGADLDPTSPPPDEELVRALRQHDSHLRPRTRALVNTRGDVDSFAVLIDAVTDELIAWDGSIDESLQSPTTERRSQYGVLRLCIRFDPVSGRLFSRLRFRVRHDFPEDRLILTDGGHHQLSCEEGITGWSSTLLDETTNQEFDAASVTWTGGFSISEKTVGWSLTFPGRRVRLLVEGAREGLPGLIETRQLPRDRAFYLVFRTEDWHLFQEWSEQECEGFRRENVREGLPSGWEFASCAGATGDRRIRSRLPELAFPEHIRLSLVGGIRSAPGFNFFAFAPPDVALEGGDGTEQLQCAGKPLVPSSGSRTYVLPRTLPRESGISIEATRNGKPIKRNIIYLTGAFDWTRSEPGQTYDEWGDAITTSGTRGVAGALFAGPTPDTTAFRRPASLVPGLEQNSAPRTFFLGRMPGQIFSWPDEPSSPEWDPVWAVAMGRRGHAFYCGGDVEDALPSPIHELADDSRRDLWKEILWRRRKRITPPAERCLSSLWRAYNEAARHA